MKISRKAALKLLGKLLLLPLIIPVLISYIFLVLVISIPSFIPILAEAMIKDDYSKFREWPEDWFGEFTPWQELTKLLRK